MMVSYVARWLAKHDIPVTRDSYLFAAYGDELPDPWTPEDENDLPAGLQNVVLDFDPNEPRDPHGRWTQGGGSAEAGSSAAGGPGGAGGDARLAEAQRSAAEAAAGFAKLEGLPDKPIDVGDGRIYVPGPFGKARQAAEDYARSAGIAYDPPKQYLKVDKARATRIANAFDEMKHAPGDLAVKASYDAMAKETLAQWQEIKKTGLQVEWIKPGQADPYARTPRLAAIDVTKNNHWWGFPTDLGYGTGDQTERHDNPMLQPTDEVVDGRKLVVNDVFRIVHDYFGHFKEGVGFRADGEENAWRSHAAMYSPLARGAMTSETRGQNSWVNYGPYGETNRKASAADTHYSEQKIGLMPEWTQNEGRKDIIRDAAMSEAAGVLFRTKTHMLLVKRKDTGEWSIPAGNLEKNETPLHGAQREAAEETGYPGDHRAYRAHTGVTRGVKFHTFVQPSEWQFAPILNPEHTQHAWVRPNKLPAPLHPGLVATLHAMSEGGGAVPLIRDYNEVHQPAGSPGGIGGQFAPAGTEGGGGALSEGVKKTKIKPEDFEKDKVALGSFVSDPSIAKKFFEEWDTRIGEAPAKFKDQFLGRMDGMKVKTKDGSEHTLHTSMKIDYRNDNSIRITGNIYNESDMRIGTYERLIDLDNLKADSAFFKLNDDYTGGNAGKRMLAGNVEVYSKLGIPKLNVHANINVGGYSWAKYGYVPTQSSWTDLRNRIQSRLSSDSRTRSGEAPGSWDEMSEDQHSDIERAWMRSTQNEFYESEVESWRDSGQALEDAKSSMAADYDPGDEWAKDAIAEWRETHEENNPKVPFTDDDILKSISFSYSSRYGDGRDDPSVDFDDEILNKSVDLSQPLLPGIEPISSKSLTQNARDEITEHLIKAFNDEAEHKAGDVDPPSYLSENVGEYQGEYWDTMDEHDRYRWARDNGELPELEIESEEGEEPVKASDEQVDALLKLASSSDPKAIWAISDSAKGKDLLLRSDWYGSLDLKDKESMDRFKAYVGKAYK